MFKFILKVLIISFFIVFTACTKCVTCTETSGVDSTKSIAKYPETCGNWRDVSDFEKRVHDNALKESTVKCVKKSKIPLVGE